MAPEGRLAGFFGLVSRTGVRRRACGLLLLWQDRRRWLLIIIGLGVFIPLTVYQNRWGTYTARFSC